MDKKTLLEALEALESIKGIGDIQPPPPHILGMLLAKMTLKKLTSILMSWVIT